jgi:acetyltransferase-like isoleucine patch superfamily enzyme
MLIKKRRIPFNEIVIQGVLPSFLKILIYKSKGYKIGKGVKIGFGSVIISKVVSIKDHSNIGYFTAIIADKVDIGSYSVIGSLTYINCMVFKLGNDSKIREQVYVGGTLNPDSELIIGNRCSIGQSSYLNPSRKICIGDDTAIGGSGFIFTHGSWQSVLDGYPAKYEPVTIDRNVYIAWRVFILPGITIGENSTIAADSSVTINVPPNSLAFGSPLKIALSGKERWPRSISSNTKVKIIENINDLFSAYLNHHKFRCDLARNGDYDILSLVGSKQSICFFKSNQTEIDLNEHNVYLFLEDAKLDLKLNNNIVILNIEKRTRDGSNELGEEYISYLSRYGIRFERI